MKNRMKERIFKIKSTIFIQILMIFGASMNFSICMSDVVKKCDIKDVNNLDLIYEKEKGFEFSLPRSILESYYSGKAFDHKVEYTADEFTRLQQDISDIFSRIMSAQPIKNKVAVISAGSPGTGKTLLMRQVLAEQATKGHVYAYIDPDDVCLRNQLRTYLPDVNKGENDYEVRKNAYTKWRPGSNAAAQVVLANLIRDKYGFFYGMTSSSPATGKFLDFLKKQGYQIKLQHVSAPDDVRWGSILERDKTFVQTTEQDVREKGLLVPQRIQDTYLKYADEIDFYFRKSVNESAVLGATWKKNQDSLEPMGVLTVIDLQNYENIKKIHDTVCAQLNRPEIRWEETIEKSSEIQFFPR